MQKILAVILIIGFIAVDFLFFHDIAKPGEVVTASQYLTGFLSILVFVLSVLVLRKNDNRTV